VNGENGPLVSPQVNVSPQLFRQHHDELQPERIGFTKVQTGRKTGAIVGNREGNQTLVVCLKLTVI